jgi:peptidoglycan/LPS O-acetylase OafA/YrhL
VRMMQLDVLRGVAILMVLLRHEVLPWSMAGVLRYPMYFAWNVGWTGVDMFFVLSGFLIGGLLFREILKTGRLDVKRFFIRRGLKIWPAYFLLIAVVFCEQLYQTRSLRHSSFIVLPNLIHVQNYLDRYHGQPWSIRQHTWSLAVEEHFYLLLPLFLMLLTRRWKKVSALSTIPIFALAVIVICNALRFVQNWNFPYEFSTHQARTHQRIDGLFFGVLLAYLYHMKPALLARIARHKWLLLIIGFALVLPTGLVTIGEHRWIWTIGYTMLYVGYGCILVACVYTAPGDGPLGKILFSLPARIFAWIGVFSYSIYLWQADLGTIPVRHYIMPYLPKHPTSMNWALSTGAYLGVTIATGIIMSKLIEMPVLALRDRLFPGRIPIPTRPAPRDSSAMAVAVAVDQQPA